MLMPETTAAQVPSQTVQKQLTLMLCRDKVKRDWQTDKQIDSFSALCIYVVNFTASILFL